MVSFVMAKPKDSSNLSSTLSLMSASWMACSPRGVSLRSFACKKWYSSARNSGEPGCGGGGKRVLLLATSSCERYSFCAATFPEYARNIMTETSAVSIGEMNFFIVVILNLKVVRTRIFLYSYAFYFNLAKINSNRLTRKIFVITRFLVGTNVVIHKR